MSLCDPYYNMDYQDIFPHKNILATVNLKSIHLSYVYLLLITANVKGKSLFYHHMAFGIGVFP